MGKDEGEQYYDSPPKIINNSRPKGYRKMLVEAAQNIRLGEYESRLLNYYCNQKSGFCPALEEVKKNTGIPANKVWEIRKQLIMRRLIEYSPNEYILICWDTIRAFALMTYPKPKKKVICKANGKNSIKRVRWNSGTDVGTIGRKLTKAESLNEKNFAKHTIFLSNRSIGEIIAKDYKRFLNPSIPDTEEIEEVEIDLRTLAFPDEAQIRYNTETIMKGRRFFQMKKAENNILNLTEKEYDEMIRIFPEYRQYKSERMTGTRYSGDIRQKEQVFFQNRGT